MTAHCKLSYVLCAASVVGGCLIGVALPIAASDRASRALTEAEMERLVGTSPNQQCPVVVDPAGCTCPNLGTMPCEQCYTQWLNQPTGTCHSGDTIMKCGNLNPQSNQNCDSTTAHCCTTYLCRCPMVQQDHTCSNGTIGGPGATCVAGSGWCGTCETTGTIDPSPNNRCQGQPATSYQCK